MKKYVLFIIFFLTFCALKAQKEAAVWYFGYNAGLDFNSGSPIAITDGALYTVEGCATISDYNGNLLFYTDGITVWNRNHQPMPNGFGLEGDRSTTQSGIIVPYPGNPNLYYIFTTDEGGGPKGLEYNIVDISLNGGLGDVTLKNVSLHTPVTEKVTAVTHANGSDIWVITHAYGNANFLAYLVTANGLITTPVISTVGFNFPVLDNGSGSRGYLKVSPDGKFLASASFGIQGEIFQFNATTGHVSNPITLTSLYPNIGILNAPYGVAFSPDSSKLYISNAVFYDIDDIDSNIHQFELSNYNSTAILNSATALGPFYDIELGALQLAIDGKIYVAQVDSSYLGVIDSPNTAGVGSNFIQNAVSLAGRKSASGLPPFIQSYFVVGIIANNLCFGETTSFQLTSGTNDPITSISWNFGDGNTSSIETPSHTYASPGTYTVSVTATTASETKTESKDITIYQVPTANTISNFEVCNTSTTYEFNLSEKNTEILGAQLATNNTITYFLSLANAQNSINALPNLYTNTAVAETIFARIQNANNPSCFAITNFDLVVKQAPTSNTVTDWVVCDDDTDGTYNFNLTQKDNEVLNGQDTSKFGVSYFETLTEAENRTNALISPFTNNSTPQTIFYRIENTSHTECFEVDSFTIEVIPEVIANTPSNFEICDTNNDGLVSVDLNDKEPEILGTQNAANVSISFHTSLADAENGIHALNKNNFTNTTPYNQILFARIENNADSSCYNTTAIEINVYNSPKINTVTDWQVCDTDNDGAFLFDFNTKEAEILGNQSTSDFEVSYYETQADANVKANAITGLFENISNPQSVFYRIENKINNACYVTNSFELQVYTKPIANKPINIRVCDTNENGIQTFDLSLKDVEIIGTQSPTVYTVSYFSTATDASTSENPLSKTTYTNSAIEETIYARIENTINPSCFDVTNFQITINPLPEPQLEKLYVICPDTPELTIDGGNFEQWSWRDETNNEINNQRFLNVNDLGAYTLTVTSANADIVCEKTVNFEVVSSGAPEDFTYNTIGFSDRITLEITTIGVGDFEYSIDGENFQQNNQIEVFPGTYTVYVRDTFLCRTITKEIIVLGYQKFFTPNGDGSNEYWTVIGMEHYPNSKLFIYDRYGKLLKQLQPANPQWDGIYQGVLMPSSDYWFQFVNQKGIAFTGHFSLKR